ncbi:uncharacterized protein THITE_2107031 [Thermothielavioides terrestris NRRL 8126]|uniref:Uncharacterized protein n=1 Tax=Thermothielavioides terrestris (strain ATCC 38088 / NRRL 8126) TaxID=578455 RepID=G2QSF3_THETT|nr:uncharacterized protein THITE_2107031 [Thermothielavioides terrestris NRRL 8126]AEO62634.1 hypothetical protein THITE_2107031 [Thermothielavioides terrestris NRRL 8126]
MAARPPLFTRGLSGLSQSSDPNSPMSSVSSPAEQRDDAKRNFLRTMRPLPTQHYWNVWFDRQQPPQQTGATKTDNSGSNNSTGEYQAHLEQVGDRIASVQDFWRYNNNMPVDQIKMRESIYLFKSGFKPVWEDRRNILGGSWTFRVPKSIGPDVWTRVQLLAIGEKLQSALEEGDQICGVGLSVRFNSHLVSVWHRDASRRASIDGLLRCVLEELPPELRPKPDNYFYKRHADHAGFRAPPELQAVLDSQRAREAAAAAAAAAAREAEEAKETGVKKTGQQEKEKEKETAAATGGAEEGTEPGGGAVAASSGGGE